MAEEIAGSKALGQVDKLAADIHGKAPEFAKRVRAFIKSGRELQTDPQNPDVAMELRLNAASIDEAIETLHALAPDERVPGSLAAEQPELQLEDLIQWDDAKRLHKYAMSTFHEWMSHEISEDTRLRRATIKRFGARIEAARKIAITGKKIDEDTAFKQSFAETASQHLFAMEKEESVFSTCQQTLLGSALAGYIEAITATADVIGRATPHPPPPGPQRPDNGHPPRPGPDNPRH